MNEPLTPKPGLVSGTQLRAARAMAGMTQRALAASLGIDERKVRFWERRRNSLPTNSVNSIRVQKVFAERRVVLIGEPVGVIQLPE